MPALSTNPEVIETAKSRIKILWDQQCDVERQKRLSEASHTDSERRSAKTWNDVCAMQRYWGMILPRVSSGKSLKNLRCPEGLGPPHKDWYRGMEELSDVDAVLAEPDPETYVVLRLVGLRDDPELHGRPTGKKRSSGRNRGRNRRRDRADRWSGF